MDGNVVIMTSDKITFSDAQEDLAIWFKTLADSFEDFPDEEYYDISPITSQEWILAMNFVKFQFLPESREDWVSLLNAADYLGVPERYIKILRREGIEKARELYDEEVFSPDITLIELASRIKNAEKIQEERKLRLLQSQRITRQPLQLFRHIIGNIENED